MKKTLAALVTVSPLICALLAGTCIACENAAAQTAAVSPGTPQERTVTRDTGGFVVTGTVPVNNAVLDPDQYIGQVKAGYAAAKAIPEICAKLFCYCGCDGTDCHGSLLDCFTSDHGVDCHICQEESILALQFHKKGKSLADIQKYIDRRYAREYPFEEETELYKKYKAERLWGNKTGSKKEAKNSATPDAKPDSSTEKRKLRKDGSCCAGDKE